MALIKVKVNTTGQIGTMDDSEFDPNVFTNLSDTQQQPPAGLPTMLQGQPTQTPIAQTPAPTVKSQFTDPDQIRLQTIARQSDPKTQAEIAKQWDSTHSYKLFDPTPATPVSPEEKAAQTQQAKDESAKKDIVGNLNTVLGIFNNIPGSQKGAVFGKQAKLPVVGGMVAPEAREYLDQKGSFAMKLKDLMTSGTGIRMTQAEINNWSNLLPSPDKTDKQNQLDIDTLNKLVNSKFGTSIDPSVISGTPATESIGQRVNDVVLPRARKVANDVGVGIAQNQSGANESQNGLLNMLPQLQAAAQKTNDPAEKNRLMTLISQASQQTGSNAANQANQYSSDVQKGVVGRSLGAASEIGSTAALVSGGINLVRNPQPAKDVLGAILNPRGALANARSAAAEGYGDQGLVNGDKIMDAVKEYASHDPRAQAIIDSGKFPDLAGKMLTPQDTLDFTDVWNKAYSAAGKTGKSAAAGVYDAAARAAKNELETNAPEVAKYTGYLRGTYAIPKAIGKASWSALKLSALGKLLGI
jgi:hypothetical protein